MKNRKIDENLILRFEMLVLMVISVIAVTIAWFVLGNRAQVKGMNLQAGSTEYIKVAVSANGEDVLKLPQNERYIDIGEPTFANTKAGQMAPGTYGEMNLYITALSPAAKGCSISVNSVPEYVAAMTDDGADEINKLLKGHIQFYASCTRDENNSPVYTDLITENQPLVVPLEEQVEKMVTIYWVWPYEYTDIPQEAKDAFVGDRTYFFDKEKYDIEKDERNEYTQADYISFYDYGDTKLGMSVKDIHFHIYVNGLQYDAGTGTGASTNRMLPDAIMADGTVAQGRAPDLELPDGAVAQGRAPDLELPDGAVAQGRAPDFAMSDGTVAHGRMLDCMSAGFVCRTG